MSKKAIIIFSAVLAFFLGAIWVGQVPVVAPLVAFLEMCAGFAAGFFFAKELAKGEVSSLNKELESLKAAQKAIAQERRAKIADTPKASKKAATIKK